MPTDVTAVALGEDEDFVVDESVDTALVGVCGAVWTVEAALSPTSIDVISLVGADEIPVTAVLGEVSSL